MKRIIGAISLGMSLVAAGCSDSDPLPTSYLLMSQRFTTVGSSTGSCIFAKVNAPITVLAADGTCAPATDNAGDPCGRASDCGVDGLCEPMAICAPGDPNAGMPCTFPSGLPCESVAACDLQGLQCVGGTNPGATCSTDDDCFPNPECLGALNDDTLQESAVSVLASQVRNIQLLSPGCGFCAGNPGAPCQTAIDCPPNVCQGSTNPGQCGLTGGSCSNICGPGDPAAGTACSPIDGAPCLSQAACINDCPQNITCNPGQGSPTIPSATLAAGRFKFGEIPMGFQYIDFGDPTDPADTVSVDCFGAFGTGATDIIPGFADPQTFELGLGRANIVNYVVDVGQLQSRLGGLTSCNSGDLLGNIEDILTIVGE